MKKFLPLVLFVLAFSFIVAVQVGWQNLTAAPASKQDGQYALYEEQFLKGKYQSIDGKTIENSKLKSPVVIINFGLLGACLVWKKCHHSSVLRKNITTIN